MKKSYLVALRPFCPSPGLEVETPKKFPGGLTSPTRDDKLGAKGTFLCGEFRAPRTDGTRLGSPEMSDGLGPRVMTSRSSLAAAAAASLSSS